MRGEREREKKPVAAVCLPIVATRGTRGGLGSSPKDPPGASSFEIDVACVSARGRQAPPFPKILHVRSDSPLRARFPRTSEWERVRGGRRENDGERGNGTNDTRGTRGRL